MEIYMIKEELERNKKQLFLSLAAVFIWGLFAHGFAFSGSYLTHDSLLELNSEVMGNQIKMGYGRVLTPIYRDLVGSDVALPWMMGLLALLWIGLSVFFMIRIFCVESPVIVCLIAGVCTTNIAVSSITATYIHDLDSYMFSLLCAVLAVYLWRDRTTGWIFGAIPAAVSLGIYQGFIFVAVTLVMLVCIFDLLNGRDFKQVFTDGMKAIGMIILGGLLYYLLMKTLLATAGLNLVGGEYNSLDRMQLLTPENLIPQVLSAYEDWLSRLVNADSGYSSALVKGLVVLLLTEIVAILIIGLRKRRVRPAQKALCVLLVVLLPLGMNMLHVMTVGNNHDLMTYPIWLIYIFALLLADWIWQQRETADGQSVNLWIAKGQRLLCIVLIFIFVYGNVRFSNGMYMKKALEHDAYMSLMTRIVARMEAMEEYVPGETEVVFVGLPEQLNAVMPGFESYSRVTGMAKSDMIYVNSRDRFQAYFDYMMGLPILLAEDDYWTDSDQMDAVQQMPVYPSLGFMQMMDGILFVKLGN